MAQMYNDPAGGVQSTVEGTGSSQMHTFFWQRKALIEAAKEMYFTPLADTTAMPKHFGKTIKVYHYIPLLDERNVNDQGIDAAGAVIENKWEVRFQSSTSAVDFTTQADADAIQAETGGTVTGTGPYTLTFASALDKAVLSTQALAELLQSAGGAEGSVVHQLSGNLYGSSKDIGTINGKLPTLTETGGRVNRVGFTRLQLEGSIEKFGLFTEFTQESLDFDSDEELYSHLSRELVTGATQLTEAVLQKDLLAGAGVVVYPGNATADSEISGEASGDALGEITYEDLMRMSRILNDNRTPKQTKVITGSRMIDTKTISSGRVLYIGSELESTIKRMTDLFGNQAFIPVQKYASAGTVLNGEIGSVDEFRIVVVPEMLHWAGAGAAETASNPGYMATAGRYDVFPLLVVGEGSFTTIGFQTSGKMMKFSITTKMPGKETADRNDPYGETGFSSIKWYYGSMILRSERLALAKSVARV